MGWNSFEKMLVFSSMLDSSLRRSRERAEIDALHRENERMRQQREESERRDEREHKQRDALKAAGLDIRDHEAPLDYLHRLVEENARLRRERTYASTERFQEFKKQSEEIERKMDLYMETTKDT